MKRCVIHIGMQKTGSTSIQQSLNGFCDDRFFFATLGHPNHGPAMFGLFAPDQPRGRDRHDAARDPVSAARYADQVRQALEQSVIAAAGRTLLISGESISVMPSDGLIRLRDYFRGHFDDISITAYVRPPGQLMSSRFQQRVRSGAVSQVEPGRQYHRYRKIFGAFDRIFGRDHVHLWKFDPPSFPGGCVVRDICARLEISLPDDNIVRRNESLTRHAVSLIYLYHQMSPRCGFAPLPGSEARRLGGQIAAIDSGKFRFSPEVVAPVLARQHADIQWMEERLGQSLHEDLGTHQPGDVRGETDLLNLDPGFISRLLELLGSAAPAGNRGETPEEAAHLFDALRKKAGTEVRNASRRRSSDTEAIDRVKMALG